MASFIAQSTFQGDTGSYGAQISYYVPEDVAEALAEAAEAEAEEEAEEEVEEEEAEEAPRGPRGGSARPQASIAILNAAGDTVQTMNGPASAGVQRVRWTFNRRSAPREPSPADRLDSLRTASMYEAVGDSLVEHEGVGRETMDQVLEMMQGGNQGAIMRMFGGGGGGGGGAGAGWQERPAERYPPPGQAGRGGGRGGGRTAAMAAAAAAASGADPAAMRTVFQQVAEAVRERGGMSTFRRFFGGGGGGGGLADPGTYTVAITLGDETFTTPLEVVRKEGFGFWDEPDGEEDR